MRRIDPDGVIEDFFYHPNTGVSSWTTNLYKNTIANNNTITITEPATNWYHVRVSVDSEENAIWHLHIYETANPTDGQHYKEYLVATAEPANLVQVNGASETISKFIQHIKNMLDGISRRLG